MTDVGLEALQDLPNLTDLELVGSLCTESVTAEGLGVLRNLPLTRLMLGDSDDGELDMSFGDEHLQALRGLPLAELDLEYRGGVTDEGLAALEGMPLTSLGLMNCVLDTGEGFTSLKGSPFTRLHLPFCEELSMRWLGWQQCRIYL